ncbi:uncharacterized protein LOC111202900 [Brassica napus]|uniref:uncharacterized protein LOC111202900 n=1 Tax=Brassica napus TaxID=3708 RepID=UPI0020787C3D|nr:uncharacterized protein LOC111202900 [Brassica napus]
MASSQSLVIPLASDSFRTSSDHYENPYYLHHNDHAGLVIVTDRLTTASDFHSWKRSIKMALNVRNKLGFIDGTIPKPSLSHRDYGACSRCNDIVATWLMNSVSKKIGQSLLFISTVEGIWNNLISRFKQDDAPRVYDIEQQLSKIEQGSLDVCAYYTELITLWEEHRNFVELPVCTCGKCECDAASLWEKLQHRSRVTKFLMGLNESYEQTRRHILMLKPIPTIEEAFNIVTQDERQRSIRPVTAVDNVAFYTVNPSTVVVDPAYVAAYNAGRAYQKPICTHCGKTGHTVHTHLYSFVAFHTVNPSTVTYGAPHSQNRTQSQSRASHTPAKPTSQDSAPQATLTNAVATVCADTDSRFISQLPPVSPHLTSGGMNLNLQSFTPQQIQSLITQFNAHVRVSEPQCSSGTVTFPSINLTFENNTLHYKHHYLSTLQSFLPKDAWIIDSGASSHACSDLGMFDSFVPVSSVTDAFPAFG